MDPEKYHNGPVAAWAENNLRSHLDVKPRFSSRAGTIFLHILLFSVPAAFFALGLFALALGTSDRATTLGPIVIGILMLIPTGVIALLGSYVRRGFAKSLDAEGVNARLGQKFPWSKLYYIDHVTKHFRVGRLTRRIKDNQLELVFEGGKVIIPPLIHDREAVWSLVNTIPTEIRDDGVPRRPGPASTPGGSPMATQEDLLAFLQSSDGTRRTSE